MPQIPSTEKGSNYDGESPPGAGDDETTPNAPWKALFTFSTREHTLLLVISVILSIITGIIVPILAFLLGRIFNNFSDYGAGTTDKDTLTANVNQNAFYLLALGGGGWLFNGCFFYAWMVYGELQAKSARTRLYDAMMSKDISWYETQKVGPGAVIARIQTHIRDLQIATSQPFGLIIQHLATVLASLGLAFFSCWDLTLVTLAAVPVGVVVLAFISGQIQPAIDRQAEMLTAATNQIKSVVDAIEVVKCFNAQNLEAWKYADIIRESSKHYLSLAKATAMQMGFVRLLTRTLFVSGFWYGSHLVQNNSRTSGQILTAFWGCLMATQTFEQILPQILVVEKGRTAGFVLGEFPGVDAKHVAGAEEKAIVPPHIDGDIHLRDVSFAYPSQPDRQCLKDVRLFFPAGETTYVVGRSGSGKSTFAALITRLYDVTKGSIFIDSRRVETLDLNWLRRNITIVQQDSVLFNDTVLRNIAFGKGSETTVKQSSLDAAIEMASLRSTLEDLPDGLDTIIGTGGTQLSGGQTQRVALARARIRDTPVLILDEVTSALDKATAAAVMDRILAWRMGKTTIIITHELSQVGPNDFTYVLSQGKVVQEGYRHVLEISKKSHFGKLLQSTGAELTSPIRPRRNTFSRSRNTRNVFSQASAMVDDPFADVEESPSNPTHGLSKLLPSPPEMAHVRPDSPSLGRNGSLRRESVISALSGATIHVSMNNTRFSMVGSAISRPSTPTQLQATPTKLPPTPLQQPSTPRRAIKQDTDEMRSPRWSVTSGISQYRKARQSWIDAQEDPLVELDRVSVETTRRTPKEPGFANTTAPLGLKQILATIWPRLSTKHRFLLVIAFFFGGIHAACTPVFSYIFSKLLATYYLPGDKSQAALQWSLTLLGMTIVDASASFVMHFLLEACGEAWVDDVRVEAMRRILDQPKSWFESSEANLTQIIEHLDRGAEEMRNLLGRFAGLLFVAATMTVAGITWCLIESWQLTLVGLASAPLVYALTGGFDRVSANWEAKSNRASEAAASIFSETFEKIKTVRSLMLEPHFRAKYGRAAALTEQIGKRRAMIAGAFFGIADSSIIFITALIFWYGSTLVASGTYPVTAITTVFSMLLFVISNVNAIVGYMPQLSSSRETATSLLKLTRISSLDNHEHLGDVRLPALGDAIHFRNVRFSYPSRPGVLALDRLNLDIPLKTSTALVGLSGSGKSTVVSLLLRLYSLRSRNSLSSPDFFPGSLKVGDIALSQLDITTWRSHLAYVPQHSKLFPGTISSNIAYGFEDTSPYNNEDSIRAAASAAGILAFIDSLPNGFETRVGEGGVGLSGGQRQKLGIARALVRKPTVLVMDEPTSALDATSAKEVRALVKDLVCQKETTVLVVTHSVEMMMACERVCVLEGGRVAEQGSFEELRGKGPRGALKRVLGGD